MKKKKPKKTTYSVYKKGKRVHKESSIEKRTRLVLGRLSIPFEQEYEIKWGIYTRYYDFCVFDEYSNPILLIECHGEFFHRQKSLAEGTVKKLNKMQKKNMINDKLKEHIAREKGIPLLILWESEINEDIEYCEDVILKHLFGDKHS